MIKTTYTTRNARPSVDESVERAIDTAVILAEIRSYNPVMDMFTGMPQTREEIRDMQKTRQRIAEFRDSDAYG